MAVVRNYTALISGTSLHDSEGKAAFYTYAFPTEVPAHYHGRFDEAALATFRPLDEAEKAAARAALEAWASISGVTLFEVAGEGDIVFSVFASGLVPEGSVAAAYYPTGATDLAIASDVFLTPGVAGDPYILRHEIGHALGLKHPHFGSPNLADDVDHLGSTVMSYNDGGGIYSGHVLGPLDEDAIQFLYGPASADGSQAASWSWDPSTSTLTQAGFAGDDSLLGVATVDIVSGHAGNDVIHGRGANDRLDGGPGADQIFGGRGDDLLLGGGGGDRLDGGEGRDRMVGGAGDDVYQVDDGADQLVEAADGGIDTAWSWISFTLPAQVENLTLTVMEPLSEAGAGSAPAAAGATIDATGNGLANILTGNSVDNVLDGAAGADTMRGGAGDDAYVVDHSGDRVIETSAAHGTDTVRSAVGYRFGDHVEHLVLTGSAAASATGNALANSLTGNGAANRLNGGGGADTMRGGGGDDLYVVDAGGDRAIESSGGGVDGVEAALTWTLAAQVENLTLTGSAAIAGTGNDLANRLTGNGGANTLSGLAGDDLLDGGGGADTMAGGAGNDLYVIGQSGDRVIETSASHGSDTVRSIISHTLGDHVEHLVLTGAAPINGTGNALGNRLTGNGHPNSLSGGGGNDTIRGGGSADSLSGGAGNDRLYGGTGNDSLAGGSGQNAFYFQTALDARNNVDTITDFSPAYDTIFLDRAVLSGIAADGALAASAFRTGTAARDADDRLLYDAASGRIYYDSDGSGAAAAILFAQVSAGTPLTHADFAAFI